MRSLWDQCPYQMRQQSTCPGSLSSMGAQVRRRPSAGQKGVLPSLDLRLPASRTASNKYLLFKPLRLWYFVTQPELPGNVAVVVMAMASKLH